MKKSRRSSAFGSATAARNTLGRSGLARVQVDEGLQPEEHRALPAIPMAKNSPSLSAEEVLPVGHGVVVSDECRCRQRTWRSGRLAQAQARLLRQTIGFAAVDLTEDLRAQGYTVTGGT